MNLFVNMIDHPEMFMNPDDIPTRNQRYFRYDSFKEVIQSQQKINDSLRQSFQLLNSMHHQHQQIQSNRWEELSDQLVALDQNAQTRNEFEMNVMNRLNELSHQQQELAADEHQLREQFTGEMSTLIETHEQFVTDELEKHRTTTEDVSKQLDELHVLQQSIAKTVNEQTKEQSDLSERLTDQEALLEKVSRQLTHYRSILYERTNVLAEKIEESYQITSAYLYTLLTGSAEPYSVFMTKQKKEKSNHQKEKQ